MCLQYAIDKCYSKTFIFFKRKLALGFGSHNTESWYLITSSYPMDGQNKLANNDWYVFKTEHRADADVRQKDCSR